MDKRAVSRKTLTIIACIVIIVVLLAGLGYYYLVPRAAPEEIVIAQVLPLTGWGSGFGTGLFWGRTKAAEDINKLGGVMVGGRRVPVRLITYDDSSDATKHTSLVTQAITQDNAIVVLSWGPFAYYTAVVAEKYETPFLMVGPFEPWAAAGPFKYSWGHTFRIGTPTPPGDFRHDNPGYTILGTFFAFTDKFADQTNRKVAVIALDDVDGRSWYGLFGKALKERGYMPYRIDENFGLYPPGTIDFSSVILAFKEANCEILWGNLPGPDFGIFWKQAHMLGWIPKVVIVGRAALYYEDVAQWGGDLPLGVATEVWWHPSYPYPGIGGRTCASLSEEWLKEKGTPINMAVGWAYASMQVVFGAIEKSGSLDKNAINNAFAALDMVVLTGPVKFISDTRDSPIPICIGQWVKTDKPWIWDLKIVHSNHPDIPIEQKPIFPLPR